jgi:hypothetical protein
MDYLCSMLRRNGSNDGSQGLAGALRAVPRALGDASAALAVPAPLGTSEGSDART